MRTSALRVAGALTTALLVAGCTGGPEMDPGPSDDRTRASADPSTGAATSRPRDPATVLEAVRTAMTAAASVVVSRTTLYPDAGADAGADGPGAVAAAFTHDEIEVAFAEPASARVLHVGEDIWTLDVVAGVGYLKDQSERKSTNRWRRLDAADTASSLRALTPAGLLSVLDAATSVAPPRDATVQEVPATCHDFVLDPGRARSLAIPPAGGTGDASGTSPPSAPVDPAGAATARLCVDAEQRPVETVVTIDGHVTTSVFSQWGFAIEALPPPDDLVDQPGS